jgi:hypothetical protein
MTLIKGSKGDEKDQQLNQATTTNHQGILQLMRRERVPPHGKRDSHYESGR